MEPWLLAVAVRPLATVVFVALVGLPARWAVRRFLKDGKLKRFLLFRIHDDF
jgi:hypothetical protein